MLIKSLLSISMSKKIGLKMSFVLCRLISAHQRRRKSSAKRRHIVCVEIGCHGNVTS